MDPPLGDADPYTWFGNWAMCVEDEDGLLLGKYRSREGASEYGDWLLSACREEEGGRAVKRGSSEGDAEEDTLPVPEFENGYDGLAFEWPDMSVEGTEGGVSDFLSVWVGWPSQRGRLLRERRLATATPNLGFQPGASPPRRGVPLAPRPPTPLAGIVLAPVQAHQHNNMHISCSGKRFAQVFSLRQDSQVCKG